MQPALRTVTKSKQMATSQAYLPRVMHAPYSAIEFSAIEKQAHALADIIEVRAEELTKILLEYESYEVVQDEIARTLDLLRNLGENSEYFRLRVNEVTTFLPRNQPLYALTCFVIVPSLMANDVHFRIPHSMRHFFPKLLAHLDVLETFPNVFVSSDTRLEFLRKRSALRVNPVTNESLPVTDVVIFTGTSIHADQLRLLFDDRTLFIANGAGHNPVIVSQDADISDAIDAVLTLQFYNQGQDCAAPNSILVHKDIFSKFCDRLREQIRAVHVGHYRDRSCRVGPISDPHDLVRILDFIIDHTEYLDPTTPGIVRAHDAILEPTVICKPLKKGGNFTEIFAPIIVVQEYESDSELALYFEDSHYSQNAMYITLYGNSNYVAKLINRPVGGKILHDKASVLHNTHLHASGVERGTQPYGGYGYGASSLTIGGKTFPKPTLPQRDIYEWIAKPILLRKSSDELRASLKHFTTTSQKNVEKLLRLMSQETHRHEEMQITNVTYVDTQALQKRKNRRFAKVDDKHAYRLLQRPNIEYVASLKPADIKDVRDVLKLVRRRSTVSRDEFNTMLYAIPLSSNSTKRENRVRQLRLFQHIYQLLLGTKSGPRLSIFLADVDLVRIRKLLDV